MSNILSKVGSNADTLSNCSDSLLLHAMVNSGWRGGVNVFIYNILFFLKNDI